VKGDDACGPKQAVAVAEHDPSLRDLQRRPHPRDDVVLDQPGRDGPRLRQPAPLLVKRVFEVLKEIAAMGKTIFLVEQNANHAPKLSQRAYLMVNGRIHFSGESAALLDNEDVRRAYLGLH
jgi:ABC-type lipopolysaccharide export system ATPase subunit